MLNGNLQHLPFAVSTVNFSSNELDSKSHQFRKAPQNYWQIEILPGAFRRGVFGL
jgi:hypothetical protein